MTVIRLLRLTVSFGLLALASIASADSWRFDPVETHRVETFGNTKIVLTTDARKNRQYPDFILSIYDKGELRAKYRGIAFEKIFASQDNSRFLGLSNSGLPGTAIVLFDKKGNLLLEVKHGMAAFEYCDESVTLARKWFHEENPSVRFVPDEKYGGYKSISLRDCKGNTGDLSTFVLKAYNKSFQRTAASGVR